MNLDGAAEHTASDVNLRPTFLGVAIALLVCAARARQMR
jgi:hypothetical protein